MPPVCVTFLPVSATATRTGALLTSSPAKSDRLTHGISLRNDVSLLGASFSRYLGPSLMACTELPGLCPGGFFPRWRWSPSQGAHPFRHRAI